jgi:lambda repressor-like predicted transcriptional regulator
LPKKELSDFLVQTCKERGLTFRSLSVKAGLSPATVHGIINRQYEPTLLSLNHLADYIGVKRPYMWKLAGLIEDIDHDAESKFVDPRMSFLLAEADNLSKPARDLIISILSAIIAFMKAK